MIEVNKNAQEDYLAIMERVREINRKKKEWQQTMQEINKIGKGVAGKSDRKSIDASALNENDNAQTENSAERADISCLKQAVNEINSLAIKLHGRENEIIKCLNGEFVRVS